MSRSPSLLKLNNKNKRKKEQSTQTKTRHESQWEVLIHKGENSFTDGSVECVSGKSYLSELQWLTMKWEPDYYQGAVKTIDNQVC